MIYKFPPNTYRPPPCSNGQTFTFRCHTLRFYSISPVILFSFISSMKVSSHPFLCFPVLLFPCSYMVIILLVIYSPSLLNTWPYHRNRLDIKRILTEMHTIIDNGTEADAMTLHLIRERMIIPVVAIIPQWNGMRESNRKITIQLFMIVYCRPT